MRKKVTTISIRLFISMYKDKKQPLTTENRVGFGGQTTHAKIQFPVHLQKFVSKAVTYGTVDSVSSRQNEIPSERNPVRTKSRQNEIPSERNPVRTKSRQNEIPSERKAEKMVCVILSCLGVRP